MANTGWCAGSEVLTLFPTLVWKLALAPAVYTPLNSAILAEIAALRGPGVLADAKAGSHRITCTAGSRCDPSSTRYKPQSTVCSLFCASPRRVSRSQAAGPR